MGAVVDAAVEQWRPVPGYDRYEVSDQGRVRSYRDRQGHPRETARILTPVVRQGYRFVKLTRARSVAIHVLVLETFVGPRPDGLECRHLDGNRSNNAVENLAWGTKAENYDDRRGHGTANDGERHGHARLTNALVLAIYRSEVGDLEAARLFDVRRKTVSSIRRGGTWCGITGATEHIKPGTKGEHNGRAKLSVQDVVAIRQSSAPAFAVAQDYGVSRNLVYMIRSRQVWKHVA